MATASAVAHYQAQAEQALIPSGEPVQDKIARGEAQRLAERFDRRSAADIEADLMATPDEILSALARMCFGGYKALSVPAQDGRFDAYSASTAKLIAVLIGGLERDSHAALAALRSRLQSHFSVIAEAQVRARRDRGYR